MKPLLGRLRDTHFWIMFFFPLILLAINDNWCYSRNGWIDPWLYLGYKLNYPTFVSDLFSSTYYESRMTPLLVGHAAFVLLPDVLANHVNHLFWYYTAIFSIYFIVKYFADRLKALIAALCFGSHGWFAAAVGWDYPDGAGVACQFLCLAFLTSALATPTPRWRLAAAGAAAAAMTHAHLFQFFFCPIFAIYYLSLAACVQGKGLIGRVFIFAFWFGIGAAAFTAVFGAISLAYGGSFLFFMPSIQFGSSFSKEVNPWVVPIEVWLREGTHLFMPLIAVALSGALLLRSFFKRDVDKVLIVFSINMIIAFLTMLFWHLNGQPVFQLIYYTSYMLPHAALFLCIVMARNRNTAVQESTRPVHASLALCVYTIILPGICLLWWLNDTLKGQLSGILPGGMSAHVLWCLAGVALSIGFLRIIFLNCAWSKPIGALGCVFAAGISGSKFSLTDTSAKETFSAVVQAHRYVFQQTEDRYPLFWYSKYAPLKSEFCAIASTYLWGYSLVNEDLPEVSEKRAQGIREIHRIFVMTQDAHELIAAQENLQARGHFSRVYARIEIPYAGSTFTIVGLDVFSAQKHSNNPVKIQYDSDTKTFKFDAEDAGKILQFSDKWTVVPGAQATNLFQRNESWGINTKALEEACAARLGPFYPSTNGMLRFVLKYKEVEGRIMFGILDHDGLTWKVKAACETKLRSLKTQEVTFEVQKNVPFWLGIGNLRKQHKGSSEILLHSIEAFYLVNSPERSEKKD